MITNVKIGLIGGGYWGKNLIREFNNCGVLDTICELNNSILDNYKIQYPNVNLTNDWNSILNNSSITAVCISLPAELHYKFSKQALLANKDVFVEKPITLDLDEAKELVSIAKTNNKILMVGHLLHYHPCVEKMKELITDNKIGKIINIVSNRLNLGKFRTQENVLWSFAPHDISVCLALCNNKLPIKMNCHGQVNLTNGIHDITNSILEMENNTYININVNWLNPYKEQRMVIIGEKGMIEFNDTLRCNKLLLYPDYIEWSNTVPTYPQPIKNEPIVIEYDTTKSPLLKECEYFVECCRERKTPITNGEEGLRVLEVLKSLQDSLENNGKNVYFNKLDYYSHPTSIIDNGAKIGINSKIWHFTHISDKAIIGENCNIGQNVFIANNTIIGNHCKIQNNVSIYSGVKCEDYVFFGPSCVLTNDKNPRSQYPKNGNYLETYIETGVTIGANATIVCGIRIGKYSLIGAGAVITKDVEPYSVMVGNPGKKISIIDEMGNISKIHNTQESSYHL